MSVKHSTSLLLHAGTSFDPLCPQDCCSHVVTHLYTSVTYRTIAGPIVPGLAGHIADQQQDQDHPKAYPNPTIHSSSGSCPVQAPQATLGMCTAPLATSSTNVNQNVLSSFVPADPRAIQQGVSTAPSLVNHILTNLASTPQKHVKYSGPNVLSQSAAGLAARLQGTVTGMLDASSASLNNIAHPSGLAAMTGSVAGGHGADKFSQKVKILMLLGMQNRL